MAIAVTLGLVMMNLLEPGAAMAPEAKARLLEEYGGEAAAARREARRAPDVTPMAIVEMFMPRNLFGAFVGNNRNALGDVLPLILFAILVGAAALKLAPRPPRAAAVRAQPRQRPDDRHRPLRAAGSRPMPCRR